jgi:integrase
MTTPTLPPDELIFVPASDQQPNPAALYLASLAPGSRRTMREALNLLASWLGVPELRNAAGEDLRCLHTPWAQVRYVHAMALRARLSEQYAPATANKTLAALRRVLQEAFRLEQMAAEDYQRAILVPVVKGQRERKGRMVTASEVLALLRACAVDPSPMGVRDGALLALLRGTGLRRAEIAALDVADYQAETGELHVRGGKGNKDRRVWVPSGTAHALERWLLLRGLQAGPLFYRAYKGRQVSTKRITAETVALVLATRAKEAGVVPCTPHDMRRTYLSDLLDAGADIATVQKLAGHEQVTTTAHYDRRGEAARRKAVELVHVPVIHG